MKRGHTTNAWHEMKLDLKNLKFSLKERERERREAPGSGLRRPRPGNPRESRSITDVCALMEPTPDSGRVLCVDGGVTYDGRVEKSRRAWWRRLR
ncbi:Tropinone reductase [Gossypium arboreum]|uniref:Tropinone reductase n=1 Tax=Gossypium arboreum TaxID=29729 RepID=A0A0B0PXI2_GOSAR|nr:Tropinone reductase [Gossypium arboreum]